MKAAKAIYGHLVQKGGNILVYIVMIMVIFAVLGVAMVSLFSTSISSSATANNNRRALYLYESGYRYALGELTATGFSSSKITALNTTTYKLPPEGDFVLNVFGPWFDSTAFQNLSNGNDLNLKIVKGKLPPGFTDRIPLSSSDVSVVNFDYPGATIPASASAVVTFKSSSDTTHLTLTVGDDFVANNNERICFAVHPASDQTLSNGGGLTVDGQARNLFPKRNGAIEINRRLLFYRELSDPGGNQVVLTNLSNKDGSSFSFNVAASDYAILSPANYYIVPEGRAGSVTYGTNFEYALGTYDTNPHPEDLKPDRDFSQDLLSNLLSNNKSDPNFAVLDEANKRVIFEKTSSLGPAQFATVWFKDTRAIGGQTNFCQQGSCLFGDGVRAFFLMTFTGSGDGFTFSLINGGNNSAASVGGDFQLGELLGYAGDSRTDNTPHWLDGTGNGLRPPKMAVEFDGFYNNSQAGYCLDADNLKPGSRFDPDFPPGSGNGRDNVQYVFWASRNPVAVPCRNNELYDDNRHNPQDSTELRWTYSPVGGLEGTQSIKTNPNDGTVYVVFGDNSSNSDSRLIAVDPLSGSLKWQFAPPLFGGDDDLNAIAVDNAGHIYLGSDASRVFALKPDGSQYWAPFIAGGQVESPMAISESLNRIYFGANAASNAVLFALNKTTGAPDWAYSKPELGEIPGGVTLDSTADPVDGRGTLYFGTDINPFLYAVRTIGTARWRYPSSTSLSSDILTQPVVNPSNRDVIFATTNGRVYALPYSTSSTPTARWIFNTGSSMESALAITQNGSTVYVGTTGGVLFALKSSDGTQLWRYPSSGNVGAIKRKPAVDGDGTIYFGSENGHVYALNPDAGPLTDAQRVRWVYPSSGSIGSIESEIEIGTDGNILFISNDGKLYSVTPATVPPNLRNLYLTDTELQAGVSGADWFGLGTWAVRVEVDRNRTPNANGKFEYTLRTWMRRCTDASACSDIVGTLYGNTRLRYDHAPSALTALPMTQTIELDSSFDTLFNSLLFGFTSAAGGATQTINISQFQLSFIRPNDPVVTADPNWP